MNYPEALEWLYATARFGAKLGLENVRCLSQAAGSPQEHPNILHVAGTNGKGSVCAMAESICRQGGLKTGLFTSPHLRNFRERLRIAGEPATPEAVAAGLSRLRQLCQEWEPHPTFFELNTVLAFDLFRRAECEVWIIETGLGGRLDATNLVLPKVVALSHIALDHEEWLGRGLRRVAAEKAGIIKPGVTVVSVPQDPEATAVIEAAAREKKAPLEFVSWSETEPPPGLVGAHQRWNAALAVAAVRAMKLNLTTETVRRGLEQVKWPGRFEIVQEHFILDGAHNPDAMENLRLTWRDRFGEERPTVIFGVLGDKNYPAMLDVLRRFAGRVIFVRVRNRRAVEENELRTVWEPWTDAPEAIWLSTLSDALDHEWCREGRVLIAGSLYLVAEALKTLEPMDGDEETVEF